MYDSTFEGFAQTLGAEGYTRWMYLDTSNLVTVGRGNKIDDSDLGSSDPALPATRLQWIDSNGNSVQEEDTRVAWSLVKNSGQSNLPMGGIDPFWQNLTTIRLSDDSVSRLVDTSTREIAKALEAKHPIVASLPADAQLATMRWAWALGPNRGGYSKFWAAIEKGDYETAAKESHWVGEDPKVFALIKALFQNANGVANQGLDPTVLFWPNNIAEQVAQTPSQPSVSGDFGVDVPALPKGVRGHVAQRVSHALSALPAIHEPTSQSDAIAQGNAVFQCCQDIASSAVEDVASGNYYGAIAAGAQAVISMLPPGKVTTLLADVENISAAALKGAAIGGAIGTLTDWFSFGLGSAAGADVGAVVAGGIQAIEDVLPWIEKDHFDPIEIAGDVISFVANAVGDLLPWNWGSSRPAQGDFRFLSDKECFPRIDPSIQNGIVPGVSWFTPRANSSLTSWQTGTGLNQSWALSFDFNIGWNYPLRSTARAKNAAWLLAFYHSERFAIRLGRKPKLLWKTVAEAFPRERDARTAYLKLCRWYGSPESFGTELPFKRGMPDSASGDPTNGMVTLNGVSDVPAYVIQSKTEFERCPLDYTYYPTLTSFDSGANCDKPDVPGKALNIFLVPDTFKLSLAELAANGGSTIQAMHMALQKAHMWNIAQKKDALVFKGIDVKPHPNFVRVLGITASILSKENRDPLRNPGKSGIIALSALGILGLILNKGNLLR